MSSTPSSSRGRRVYVLRHGERVDYLFPNWIKDAFENGSYQRLDLNMPKRVPKRLNATDWHNDTPITSIGHAQARLVGDAMKDKNISISAVFVSPALRCVETATSALEALGLNIPLSIEPGFFEWLGFLWNKMPSYFPPADLQSHGFNINTEYQPVTTLADLQKILDKETIEGLYARNSKTLEEVLKRTSGDILIVAHAISLETCTRSFVKGTKVTLNNIQSLCSNVGFCSLAAIEESGKTWKYCEPPSGPITNSANPTFDWRVIAE